MEPVRPYHTLTFVTDKYPAFETLYQAGIKDRKELSRRLACSLPEIDKLMARYDLDHMDEMEFNELFKGDSDATGN